MGVLDDAIREHLELKRKHGAAEEDVQRQQEEALGPARRDVAQQHEDEADQPLEPAAAAQETALFDGEDAPVAEDGEAAEPTPLEPPPTEVASADPDVPALSEEPPVAGQPPVGQEPDIGSHAPTEAADEPADAEPHEPDLVEPESESGTPDPRDARLGDTQPHGFDAMDEDDAEDADHGEPAGEEDDLLLSDPEADEQDVLEDTPDFLQETPEHDRLWFEQKPPRDFDFD
jgi:hypothetical protein